MLPVFSWSDHRELEKISLGTNVWMEIRLHLQFMVPV